MTLTTPEYAGAVHGGPTPYERMTASRGGTELSVEWIFDGIGTELISLVIGLLTGGAAGWSLHKRQVRISIKAGDHSNQSVIYKSRNEDQK